MVDEMSTTVEPPGAGPLAASSRDETLEQRLERGRALRDVVSRASHARWAPAHDRGDPVALLERTSENRLAELVPLRYGRMSESPFAFYRGAAAIMAADLAKTPITGLYTQLSGDAHLMNFGVYASPERQLVFDVNDFDETFQGPWEWDLKRLAASIVLAGRSINLSVGLYERAVVRAAAAYRARMRESAHGTSLEAWYANVDAKTIAQLHRGALEKLRAPIRRTARSHTQERTFPKLTELVGGERRIIDNPPLVFHSTSMIEDARLDEAIAEYRSTLRPEQRVLVDRYRYVDGAMKVVGVGSVGTFCAVALFMANSRDPLLLQVKEAVHSVLEPFVNRRPYDHQGERVVVGQRMLQATSDEFLGWTTGSAGRYFYVRQLRDMKASPEIEEMTPAEFRGYAELCGLTLARAHARAGDPALIAGYVGRSDRLDRALGEFAGKYADQMERDHAALVAAIAAHRLPSRGA
jgi:uncharacterized protein (DUF2252 family)